ncbi:MAG: ribosome biogenesis GTPase Der, partial [Gemmatimonadetes bacterium]|nr:ribosome biogenesis GTPase Der [Gemmatimonadota bacterium]NIQ53168.1 ribosome biogenesis GTPase Der [Gemmatimonadota bacterium]NIU73312.1 ribosome biogenesis GTPase Der [Gammaproteobacteria bacterium]NIX43559.1 ribosome biogenesis GTPase Der [Gemmatimonadota bacterium]NIY07751.1 ribosome biogenesis GTPase Der [Gemmatimonadota bacterium]
MSRALPSVAVVGRPNVGKSTLFNRVVGRRQAIVEDTPGVTRDRNFARAEWAGREFYIVDTGGLEPDVNEPLAAAIRRQVEAALQEAEVIAFVVDTRAGVQPLDLKIADLLRKTEVPVVLVVNKVDNLPDDHSYLDFWELGLGEPRPVSALSGKGSGDVLDALVAHLPEMEEPPEEALAVAVVGKPNVGKSSFINRLLGEERLVVSEMAGTTRDSIDTLMRYHGRTLIFVDTAGLRRQSRIHESLEYYSALRTERAVERADVCLLLVDGTEPVHVQDLKIAEKAWKAGCGLVVVVNKWDLVEKETGTAPAFERYLRERAPSLRWAPVIFTSALTGQRVHKTLERLLEVAEERARRVPTAEVNEVLRELAERQPPPHYRGRPVRLLYGTQS